MKQVDCSRCWFAKRKPGSTHTDGDRRFECGHPGRSRAKAPVARTLGPTGLVQLVACPKA